MSRLTPGSGFKVPGSELKKEAPQKTTLPNFVNCFPQNPKPLNPKPLNPKPLNPKPLNPTLHTPVRTCIACRSKGSKSQLLRIVKTNNLALEIDVTQTKPGRGAYLCFNENCFQLAVKKKLLSRHLNSAKQNLNLDQLLKTLDART